MDEDDEYEMKTQDHIAQIMLRDLEMEWEEQRPVGRSDLLPRLTWLAAIACQTTGRVERRCRLRRLMACALEWQVQDEMEARDGRAK